MYVQESWCRERSIFLHSRSRVKVVVLATSPPNTKNCANPRGRGVVGRNQKHVHRGDRGRIGAGNQVMYLATVKLVAMMGTYIEKNC